jgi:hypothetical protein
MDLKSRKAYMVAISERYHKACKDAKTRILNELCEVSGYNRKYAIWKINHWRTHQAVPPPDLWPDQTGHASPASDSGPL